MTISDQAPENKPKKLMDQLQNYWRSGNKAKIIVLGAVFFSLCLCCNVLGMIGGNKQAPAASTADTDAVFTTVAETAWAPYTQTALAIPTLTVTPEITKTPIPSPTFTATPQPVVLSGTGDMIVDVQKWKGPAILEVAYASGGNFAVISYGPNNDKLDLLINTIGAYQGRVPLDFLDNQYTVRFEVKASGPWQMQILPLAMAHTYSLPATINGVGDDVIILTGGNADLIKADNSQGNSNFAVWAYSYTKGRDLIFNEIAPYTGQSLLAPDTFVITVTATNNWTIEITTR